MTDVLAADAPADLQQPAASAPVEGKRTGADHAAAHDQERAPSASRPHGAPLPPEHDGPKGPEPTRFGDWEQKGRCTDF